MRSSVIARLLKSHEPSVRFNVLTRVLGRKRDADDVRRVHEEIRVSPRVEKILSEQQADGRIPFHPYAKWYGAHWVLVVLADMDYPCGDERLIPLREQVYAWLFGKAHALQTAA